MNCYNGEKFINSSVNSVLQQTYKNWELIFWDNNSKDNSAKILKKFNDKRIKYFYSPIHEKLYRARNQAIKKSNGKYISFLDVDDTWEKDKLKIQINKIIKTKSDIIYSNHWIMKNKKKRKFKKTNFSFLNLFEEMLLDYPISILTVIMRSDIFKSKNYKFDERYEIIGDFDLFYRLCNNFKFLYVHKPLATYNIHNDNLSKKKLLSEINEFNYWIKKNKNILNNFDNSIIEKNNIRICEYFLSKNRLGFFSKEIKKIKNYKIRYKIYLKVFLKKIRII